jgi:hypothetical protein
MQFRKDPNSARHCQTDDNREWRATLDFKANEIEECELIVAGETWHKIAGFIGRLAR